jgi:hypothetical protein
MQRLKAVLSMPANTTQRVVRFFLEQILLCQAKTLLQPIDLNIERLLKVNAGGGSKTQASGDQAPDGSEVLGG